MAAGDSARAEAERVRKKIATLQRYLDAQERGAFGEQRTAERLHLLGPEWVAFHDLRWPGRRLANVDHVVIGPGGIFVIDSKNWSGAVRVTHGVLRQNGYSREQNVASAASAALAVAELTGGYAAHVHPVLCFVSQPDLRGTARDVLLCSDDTVVELLQSRPRVLSPTEVLDAATMLDAQLWSATDPEAGKPPILPRVTRLPPAVFPPGHHMRRRGGRRRALLAVVVDFCTRRPDSRLLHRGGRVTGA